MNKDWDGNKKSVFTTLGTSYFTEEEREINDYYATEPKAGILLLELENFNKDIWECACGAGHLSKVFENAGYNVKSTDLIYRGYGEGNVDFLDKNNKEWHGDIITNPPYKYALEFVKKSLEIIPDGNKIAMFLKILFLEGKERKNFFLENPPKVIYVSSSRIKCAKNGNFDRYSSSAIAYAWFIWIKGYKGITEIKWFN